MYVPDAFREDRPDVLRDAMRQIGLATLATQGSDGIEANHLPMLLQGDVLRGHVWYPSKAEHGKAVPTWNYLTVHARGPIRWIADAHWLRAHVTALSDVHEADRSEPWAVSDAPAAYIDTMLRGIVGFEIAVELLEGKWKLSQNRDVTDRDGVREGLLKEGREDIARLIC
jgi:transcriptional regulator